MAESTDVSNTTIAILIVLVILISAVGTWTVLNSVKSSAGSNELLITAKQAEIRLVGASVLEQHPNPQGVDEKQQDLPQGEDGRP
ncbi:hypothetical protein HYU19_02695 [Candidatus Woesearchaeota archaeon]|nr:hypothetical protein [Candidatus Woesearchaeota archaeon]